MIRQIKPNNHDNNNHVKNFHQKSKVQGASSRAAKRLKTKDIRKLQH